MGDISGCLWTFRARRIRVVDGDTLDVTIDCGFHTYRVERVRLLGVNTPELHASDPGLRQAAQEAKAFTNRWCADHLHGTVSPEGWPLLLRTSKSDVFGRWLASVFCVEGHSLVDDLLAQGYPVWERR